MDPDLDVVLLARERRGLWKDILLVIRKWKVQSSRTPGLNPTSEFSRVELAFKPSVLLLLNGMKIGKIMQP